MLAGIDGGTRWLGPWEAAWFDEPDPEKADIVRLRFFVGFSNEETAVLLGIDERTVRRHWTFAKAWLTRRLRDG